jgi:hypothetical protein
MRRALWRGLGAVLAVAVVVAAAAVLPQAFDDGDAGSTVSPSAGALSSTASVSAEPAMAKPMPGVPRGEAAVEPIGKAEAMRRCRIQASVVLGRDIPPFIDFLSGLSLDSDDPYWPGETAYADLGERGFFCTIPGDLVPAEADLVGADEQAIATDPQALLRRCSTMLWHDLRGWRLAASSVQTGVMAAVVAVSPSGKFAAHCYLGGKAVRRPASGSTVFESHLTTARYPPNRLRDFVSVHEAGYFQEVYDTCAMSGVQCAGQLFVETRRLPLNVTRVRIESVRGGPNHPLDMTAPGPVTGPTTEVAVRDGWLAVAWADGLRTRCGRAEVTAYDARGRVVGVVSDPNGDGRCRTAR